MSSKKKKITTSVTAAVLVLALGLAGTFAWSGGDESDGEIEDTATPAVKLHDDYNTALPSTTEVRNRDIYVENTGDTALYIRVRLDEFMSYGGRSLITGGVQGNKATWKAHVPGGTDTTDCQTGIHDYFELGFGGETSYNTNVKNRFSTDGSDRLDQSKAQKTDKAKVVSMSAYSSMTDAQKAADKYWILDTDGYAYWSEKLPGMNRTTKATHATGLLLHTITNTGVIDDAFYYGINAKMEAVTESDLNAWFNGTPPIGEAVKSNRASEQAIAVLKGISSKYVKVTKGMEAFDDDNDGFLNKSEYKAYLEANPVTPTP